ncbi:MAG: DUF6091 family protein [Pseudomonadales bacterium]|nr:DUF6091 family protein [Pseudomonadales bacterium]
MKRFLVLVFTLVTMLSTHSYAEQNQNSTGEMPVRLELATAIKKSICVYDPLGKKGDIYNIVNDYALDMATTGVQFELIPFTDESVAVGDFLARQCDMIAATDIRLRPFSKFAGTISAVGALPSTEDLRILLRTLNRRKAEKWLDNGRFAVMGIFPMGAGYLFVDDRSMNSAQKLAGKKIATLTHHPDAMHMTRYVGATPVPSEVTTFGGKFNNGSVNVCYAPAAAYNAFELYRGLGENGGIIKYPLGQLTLLLVSRSNEFDLNFKRKSRRTAMGMFHKAFHIVRQHELSIDKKYWVDIPQQDIDGYQEMFRQNRMSLRDEGVYDAKLLKVMRKVRCISNRAAPECARDADRE